MNLCVSEKEILVVVKDKHVIDVQEGPVTLEDITQIPGEIVLKNVGIRSMSVWIVEGLGYEAI